MRSKRTYFKGTSFLDLLFNILLLFFALFTIAFLSIKVETEKTLVAPKAEYVLTLTWDNESADDVDIYVQSPDGGLVFYKTLSKGLVHLDRDDRGDANDTIRLATGEIVRYKFNQEIATIRGIIPGEWIINVHMYMKRTKSPTHVRVTMSRLNPSVENVFTEDLVMEAVWEEHTVARFTMLKNGDIINLSKLPKKLIETGNAPNQTPSWREMTR